MVRRADVAEDLTQDVFCRAWEARESYQEQGKSLAYLLRIADHLVCRRWRRRKPVVNMDKQGWRCHEPASLAAAPLDVAAITEQMALLDKAMECLSPTQQRVLLLRYYGQLNFAEIAEITEIPLSTTLSHCRRGMEALRKLLGPD
jgi:RNA polymerase sigma-70 factor (ECF subfamily)